MRAEKRHMIEQAVDKMSAICEQEGYGVYSAKDRRREFVKLSNRLIEGDITKQDFDDFKEVS